MTDSREQFAGLMSGVGLPLNADGSCLDRFVWDSDLELCRIKCLTEVFSEGELISFRVVDGVLSCLGFLLCYFYCLTALFRPVMRRGISFTVFMMHLCLGLFCVAMFFPLFLGPREVLCNSPTEEATRKNTACVISGAFPGQSTDETGKLSEE